MKSILLFVLLNLISIFAFGQRVNETILTYYHKLEFSNQLIAGQKHRFIQQCTTETDSIVQGTIHFNIAKIGTINKCRTGFRIINDTIRDYYIQTKKKSETNKLIEQSIKTYTKPHSIITYKRMTVYFWYKNINNKEIITTLILTRNRKEGFLHSVSN